MKIFRPKLFIMLGGAILLFGGIFGFKAFVNSIIADVFDNMEPETVTISTSVARTETWTPVRSAVGTFQASEGALLSTEIAGIVREIHFANGDRVRAGDKLISLDTETDQAELARLKAAHRLAKIELGRQERLFEREAIPRSVLDSAQSQADQAAAAVQTQKARINQKIIRAPFDGNTGIRRVNRGQFVGAGDPLVNLQAVDPIFLEFDLPQRLIGNVELNSPVQAKPDGRDGEGFEGRITALEPSVDPSSRSLKIQATFENSEAKLRPGMFARVELELGQPQEVLLIPQTAIRFSTYGNSVFVVKEEEDAKKVVQRFIQTGERRGDMIVVTDGLKEGDEVASSGLLKLRNQARVRINNDEATRPPESTNPRPGNT